MRFLHVSSNPHLELTSETFITPALEDVERSNDWYNFTLYRQNFLSLSKANEDGNSSWYNRITTRYNDRLENGRPVSENPATFKKIYFDIDLEASRIFTVNNATDLFNLFTIYGIYKKSTDACDSEFVTGLRNDVSRNTEIITRNNELLVSLNSTLRILEHFINTHIKSEKIEKLKDGSVESETAKSNSRNMELNMDNVGIIIPRSGMTLTFISTVLNEKKTICEEIEELQTANVKHNKYINASHFYTLDYVKMKRDGYNGIYYSQPLIDSCVRHEDGYIISLNFGNEELEVLQNYYDGESDVVYFLKEFVGWLGIDTLLLWNWIF
jgi:hypothetical protein